jgi:hypothetical protein
VSTGRSADNRRRINGRDTDMGSGMALEMEYMYEI